MQLKLKYISISFLLLLSIIFLVNTCTAKDTADIIFENDTGIDVKYTDSSIIFTALDNDKVKKTQNVKIHESVFENLIGFDGTSVGYTHIADDGTVTNREIDITKIKDKDGYIQFEMEFSTVIISGFAGYTSYSGTGITTNVTIEFSDTLNATYLTGPINNNYVAEEVENLSWWASGITSSDRVWFKIPELNASETRQFALTYDNGYNSSANATFLWFNNCTSTAGWTGDTSALSIYNGKLRYLDAGSAAYSVYYAHGATIPDDCILDVNCAVTDYSTDYFIIITTPAASLTTRYSQAVFDEGDNRWEDISGTTIASGVKYTNMVWSINHRLSESKIDYHILYTNYTEYGSLNDQSYAWGTPTGGFSHIILVGGSTSRYADVRFDHMFIREYAETDPTITVDDMGSYYMITVTNNDAVNYTDLQVSFNPADINLTAVSDYLRITKYAPTSATFNVSIDGVSQNQLINASSNATFGLSPATPADNFSITTDLFPADYDYNFTLYWQENITLFHEALEGLEWSASIDHTNKENTINGTITYTPVYTNVQNMEMVTTNANASFEYNGTTIIVYTGALSAGDHNIYLFGGTIPGYTIYLHALDSVSGATINTFAGYLGNSYLTTTNGTIVFTDTPSGTYNIAASATGYNDNVVRQTITGDTTVNINLVESGGGGEDIVYQDSGFVVGLSVGLLLILIYRRRL